MARRSSSRGRRRQRSGLRGVSSLRRKLRRMPDEATAVIRKEIERAAREIELDALGLVPVDQGDLAQSIDVRIARDGLTAVVGPGVGAAEIVRKKAGSSFATRSEKVRLSPRNKIALFQFFKGFWIEFGTKGTGDQPAVPARPFMSPAYDMNRPVLMRRITNAINAALKRVAES